MRICEVVNPETGMRKTMPKLLLAFFAVMMAAGSASAQLITATYAGKTVGLISKKEVLADSMIVIKEPGVRVVSFQMSLLGPWMDATKFDCDSNLLTPKMRKELKYIKKDDMLFFIHIKAVNEKGDTLRADPIKFKIK